ncbi:hypothetical protein [Sphingobacterium puteale]|uniref:hypothetical protein n=1 Tax=Sphingobacterium puteale TaxID=2420510 RepID=UPI003D96150E
MKTLSEGSIAKFKLNTSVKNERIFLVHLRQIMKQLDKSIKAFYAALQRNLKKIPDLRNSLTTGTKKHYYLPTSKTIIPQKRIAVLSKCPGKNIIFARVWFINRNNNTMQEGTVKF